ncbi:DUF2071 domain-containing protein [Paeniglutamicibacter sp. NPDC012692]|uniref:DUF2071 domain-containing protein n=1 Tax=Paeniglutamicibacter sp. NPDC012692 TaxID=3364388 RepID=UPI0036B81C93
MKMPTLDATISRRLLVNYRLDPEVAQSLLPSGLRPRLVGDAAVGGICLLRLSAVRPQWIGANVGWSAENAAHRIAVEWDDESGTRNGVFIPVRHSSSRLPVVLGGTLLPGRHEHAGFSVSESPSRITIDARALDMRVHADVSDSTEWVSRLFGTLGEASAFQREGTIGWSPAKGGKTLDGLELSTRQWEVGATEIHDIGSSYFDSLPPGAAELDHVLVMRDVPVKWSASEFPKARNQSIC